MCIAILNRSVMLKKQALQNCWDNNNDGAGMAYFNRGRLVIHKEMNDFESFYSKYQEARRKCPNKPFIIHFRITTHGGTSLENCHPFPIGKEDVFCHNGILRCVEAGGALSDTRVFGQNILEQIDLDYGDSQNFLLGRMIESSNKLIIMNKTGKYMIINEKEGDWDEKGNWYSNTSHKYSYKNRYSPAPAASTWNGRSGGSGIGFSNRTFEEIDEIVEDFERGLPEQVDEFTSLDFEYEEEYVKLASKQYESKIKLAKDKLTKKQYDVVMEEIDNMYEMLDEWYGDSGWLDDLAQVVTFGAFVKHRLDLNAEQLALPA